MNFLPWSPEIVKNFGVGTYGPIRRPRIPLVKGGESVIRLSLAGRRLVNLLPVAQRTNAFTVAPVLGPKQKTMAMSPSSTVVYGGQHDQIPNM